MTKRQQFPIGHSINMAVQDIDPYPIFDRLLLDEPVSWVDEIDMWYVTRREDVLRILSDTDVFTVVSDKSLMRQAMGYNMLTTDGAEQARLRRPFSSSFAPRSIRQRTEPFIAQLAHELIDTFSDFDEVGIKTEFADIISIKVVIDSLGLEVNDYTKVRQWVSDFRDVMSNFSQDPDIIKRGEQSFSQFSHYVQSHLDAVRINPNHSILSHLATQTEYHLTDSEIIDAIRVIIFGGVETTSALITNTLYCLLSHPEQYEEIRQNPDELLPNAVEESLRYESPVQTCTRHVLKDVDIAGVRLKKGDTLQCMLGASNRDPSYFDNPNQFDVHRKNARDHLAFANGKHFCIGAGLARMEAIISLQVLMERFPNLRLLYPDRDKPRGYEFRSSHRLSVKTT